MILIVATFCRSDHRSGASVPRARQALLRLSIRAIGFRTSEVISSESARSVNQKHAHLAMDPPAAIVGLKVFYRDLPFHKMRIAILDLDLACSHKIDKQFSSPL